MDKNRFKLTNLLKTKNLATKFIININENSSNSEGESENDEPTDQKPTTSTVLSPSKSEQSSLNSANRKLKLKKNEEIDKNVAFKINTSTIKNTIDKRLTSNLKIKLQETDQHYNRLRKLINNKNKNVLQMRSKIVESQLKLRKQQSQAKKLYAQYLETTKSINENLKEITTLTNSVGTIQAGIESDKKLMAILESRSKNFEKQIKDSQDEQLTIQMPDDKSIGLEQKPSPLSPDNMSLDSSDEQLNLILEHNDTSLNRKESLFVQFAQTDSNKTTSEPPRKILKTDLNDKNLSELIDPKLDELRKASKKPSPAKKLITLNDNKTPTLPAKKLIILNDKTASPKKQPILNNKIPSGKKLITLNNSNKATPVKKKPFDKRKNALLNKMLMIEERNEKAEELNKKKLMNEKKDRDIIELKLALKNKQILAKALISLKKDIRNLLKLNDKTENYDLLSNGLSLFLNITLDKSYLLDNLNILTGDEVLNNNLNKGSKSLDFEDTNYSIYSNNLIQTSPNEPSTSSTSSCLSGSVLESIRAYRLSNNFEEKYIKNNGQDFTLVVDSFFANKINPYSSTCNFDLNGKCNDDNCHAQHKKDFILDQRQKAIDLLLYNPSITRYKGKVETEEDMKGLLKHLNTFIDNLEKKYSYNDLIKYLVKLVRISDDESIIIKTKVQMQQTENTTINEHISSTQQTNGQFNTFADFKYNFKIRDRKNVLTYSKLTNPVANKENDLECEQFDQNQQRFFNANGKSLEELGQDNSTDIRYWIKLAYQQINSINCNRKLKKQQLQNAVKVVIKALDTNRVSLELWKTYLYLLINLLNSTETDESFEKIEKQLKFICQKILKQYPNYELWKFYLSLSLNFLNKELISSEIVDEIETDKIKFYDINNNYNEELRSNAYLEMIIYKVNLYIEINRIEKAKTYVGSILASEDIQSMSVIDASKFIKSIFSFNQRVEDRKRYEETSLLTNEDKVFLWLNYLFLVHTNRLPNDKFDLFKQSFSSIKDKRSFLVKFSANAIKKPNLDKLVGIIIEALKDCFFNFKSNLSEYHHQAQKQIKKQMQQQNLITCLPLFHNLANLFFLANKKQLASDVFNDILAEDNQELVPLLINKAIFEEINDYEDEAKYTLGDNQIYKQDNFELIYFLCLLHFKHGNFKFFNFEVSKILRLFFEFDRSLPIKNSFKKLLYNNFVLDNDKQKLMDRFGSRLWTLYLMSEILASSEETIDSVLNNSLSLCKLNKNTKEHTVNLIHFLYLNFYAKTISNQQKLDEFLDKLQYALLFNEDHQFQYNLLKHFSNCFFSIEQRFKFFLKFTLLIPQNKYILNHLLNLGFNEMNDKERCYQILKYFIGRKHLQMLLEPIHWFLVIYLANDFKEHLNLHHYFQLALSNYPYNKKLWYYLLAYEVSQNHTEHVTKIRSTLNKLRIPDVEKQLIFD